jgi:hypothetical protein
MLHALWPRAREVGSSDARVVNIANWSDENLSSLAAHELEPTDAIIELGSKH